MNAPVCTPDLVTARRDRVFEAMEVAGFDALVLGHQANATYASGVQRLWTAGTRPFGAGCVLMAVDHQVFALSSWDAGVPETIPFDNLYGMTWNPSTMSTAMKSIDGLTRASRIGVDAVSPGFARAAARFAPDAVIEPADELMSAVRRHKMSEEVALIAHACEIARVGVRAVLAGVSTDPVASAVAAMAAAGSSTPSSAPRAELRDGEWDIDLGIIYEGYEGGLGGTHDAGGSRLGDNRLADACVVGTTWEDLDSTAGGDEWCVRGLGLGFELPLWGPTHRSDDVLDRDMMLSVAVGDRRDVVSITADGPRVV